MFAQRLCTIVLSLSPLLAFSCKDTISTNSGTLQPARAFEPYFQITADTNKAVQGRPMQIILRVTPVITGKGRMGIYGHGSYGSIWVVEAPVQDTLRNLEGDTTIVWSNASFVAKQAFEQRWTIWLLNESDYVWGAVGTMDSIFIADSSRMYHIFSDVAKKYSPLGIGWNPDVVSDSLLHLPHP